MSHFKAKMHRIRFLAFGRLSLCPFGRLCDQLDTKSNAHGSHGDFVHSIARLVCACGAKQCDAVMHRE